MYVLLQGYYNNIKTKKKVLTVGIPVSESSRIVRSITYNNRNKTKAFQDCKILLELTSRPHSHGYDLNWVKLLLFMF